MNTPRVYLFNAHVREERKKPKKIYTSLLMNHHTTKNPTLMWCKIYWRI